MMGKLRFCDICEVSIPVQSTPYRLSNSKIVCCNCAREFREKRARKGNARVETRPARMGGIAELVGREYATALWIFIGVAVLVLGFIGMIANDRERLREPPEAAVSDEPKRMPSPDQVLAVVLAQSLVRDRLKSPASAKFQFPQVMAWMYPESGMGKVWVRGKVDSQNLFGAVLTSTYSVYLSWVPATDEHGKYWRGTVDDHYAFEVLGEVEVF